MVCGFIGWGALNRFLRHPEPGCTRCAGAR
jgi:hypothetical protein